ncbi:Heat shock factor (HSF)-type [Macleaya cordata]|uniref:Heat shock factor (HSF)-type n=1 Tax=Macleaya cordata TaxID=56857 RepID=A0A200PWB3_MACCD|nr:Heat shock factor (HSF)-type [Macleaya cordata]
MVDDPLTDSIISWSPSNDNFIIWDMTAFQRDLLPKYFKHSNFSSFMRQLNTYGFRKSDPDRWEFGNNGFVKGQKHLLRDINRRKHPQGLSQKESQQNKTYVVPCVEVGMFGLHQEVEILKRDKNVLMQELVKCRQHQRSTECELHCLRQRIKGMEKSQQQMLSLLVMAMQSPGFLAQLVQQKEKNWRMADTRKKRRLPALGKTKEDGEPEASEGQIVRYQPLTNETPKPLLLPISDTAESEQSDPSPSGFDDFFTDIDFMSFGEVLPLPMEADMLSSETEGPYILPDLPEDMMEQLLLVSPRPGDIDEMELNTPLDLENEMGVKSTNCDSRMETMQSVDVLTEQMGLLASEENNTSEKP